MKPGNCIGQGRNNENKERNEIQMILNSWVKICSNEIEFESTRNIAMRMLHLK